MTGAVPSRSREWIGIFGGALMMASGALHSIAGWPALQATMRETNTPRMVVDGLAVPWHFAGAGMIVFGLLVILDLRGARRGAASSPPMSRVIGGCYLAFGLAGLVAIKLDPTFAMFIIPGLLALIAR